MNQHSSRDPYDAVATLERSLFGFALVAWIPLFVTSTLLLLAPSSPVASYAQLQRTIVAGFGIATMLVLAATVWTYRLEASTSRLIATRLVSAFCSRWLALALVLLLVEGNMFALSMIRDIAPSITNPVFFLLLCWSLEFAGLLLTIHWRSLNAFYEKYRGLLVLGGGSLITLILLAILLAFNSHLVKESGINDRLRGGLDYRLLRFVDDGKAPTAQQFWAEQGQTRVRWLPFSYWTVAPIAGEFINVDETGLRRTISVSPDADAPKVYFFGGSTMWGEGARDLYTIPSQVSQLLADRGIPAFVQNYAQTGYVSSQDLILFQAQLALGNLPDLAVFYQGFNDILSAHYQGMAGVSLRENHRAGDVEAGRLLRQGTPVLRLPGIDLDQVNWSLIATAGASAQEIVDRWIANRRLIRAAGAEYGVKILFVWQPTILAKAIRTEFEAQTIAEIERDRPGFFDLYRDVDSLLRERISAEAWDDIVILTDLFSQNEEDIFNDEVHINEVGNTLVAEEIVLPIADRLAGE